MKIARNLLFLLAWASVGSGQDTEKLPKAAAHAQTAASGDAGAASAQNAANGEAATPANDDSAQIKTDPCEACCKTHHGVMHRATDPENLNVGCLVYAILKDGKLELRRGKDVVQSFTVSAIQTPLLFVPMSDMCFIVKGSEGSEILCSENFMCRNEWWKAITRAVLCSHAGTPMRHEIAGEPYDEELTEMVVDEAVEDPEKQGGIEIKLTGFSDLPVVKVQ